MQLSAGVLPSCGLTLMLMHVALLQGSVTGSREVAEHAAGSSVKAMAAEQIDTGALPILTEAHPDPLSTLNRLMQSAS